MMRGGQKPGSVVAGQQPLPQCEQDKGGDCGLQERTAEHSPIHIDGAVVEWVENLKFLGVHITNKQSWSKLEVDRLCFFQRQFRLLEDQKKLTPINRMI